MSVIPAAIKRLLAAVNAQDTDRVLAVFAPDAVVTDDGRTFTGHDQIRRWSDQETVAVRVVLEPVDVRTEDGLAVVDVRAAGNFPGSPLPFVFRFRPADPAFERIAELTVAFAG